MWKDGNSSEEAFETVAFPKDLALNIAVRSIGEFLFFYEEALLESNEIERLY